MEDVPEDSIFEALYINGSSIDAQQADIAGFSGDPDMASSKDECAYVERCVIFTASAVSMNEYEDSRVVDRRGGVESAATTRNIEKDLDSIASNAPNIPEHEMPKFHVHTSKKFANPFDSSLDAKTYPHLFLYGRGHPGEENRRVKVSKKECVQLYCHLRTRRFAQDPYYIMTSFDRFAVRLTQHL